MRSSIRASLVASFFALTCAAPLPVAAPVLGVALAGLGLTARRRRA